jgi:TPR repeat protein
LAATLLAMTLAGTACADPLDEATAAYGRGDYESAARLLLRLAAEGNSAAQYNLGLMYNHGEGVTKDQDEAIRWFRRAAEQGDADAQYALGVIYREGKGVPKNDAEAARWYRLAAERGNPIAQFNLGFMYGRGEGVRQNYVEAYRWFTLAAAGLSGSDPDQRDKAIRNRGVLAASMSPEQIAAAQKLARDWSPTK